MEYIEILKKYVVNHDCDEEDIVELCKNQPPKTLTVYRGQKRNETLHDADTYSSSLNEQEASKFSGEEGCCLFVIHLVNVPCIDVNALVGEEIGKRYREEQEIIFLGGGTFYSDESFSDKGFVEISPYRGKRRFECWYTFSQPDVLNDLIDYVTEQKTTKESVERIRKFCEQQRPISLVLYRGHKRDDPVIRHNNFWYSATSSKQIAKDEFSSKSCCVFTIHLINVPAIDINEHIGDKIKGYKQEKEYIFLGGGTFYQDETLEEEGFSDKHNGEFECWYKIDLSSPPPANEFNLDRILVLLEDEYDLIDEVADIFLDGLTEDQKVLVCSEIQEIKKHRPCQGGGNHTKPKRPSKRRRSMNKKTIKKRIKR